MSDTGNWSGPDASDPGRESGEQGTPTGPDSDRTPARGLGIPESHGFAHPGQDSGQQTGQPMDRQPAYGQQPYPQAPQPQWSPHGYGKPGVIPLRPLNLGEILDGAITAMRRYPGLILGVSAVIAVVGALLGFLSSVWLLPSLQQMSELGPAATQQEIMNQFYDVLGPSLAAAGAGLAVSLLTRTFLSGFLTVVLGRAVLGRPVTFREAMAETRPRLLPLLGLTLIYALAVLVGLLFCIVGAVVPYVFLALATPALVLERGRIGQAMKRSRLLVAGSFWRVLGILLLATLIGAAITTIIGLPFSAGSGAFSGIFNPGSLPVLTTGGLLLQSVGAMVADAIVTPFIASVTVLLYLDQRMRKEGMDIELARVAGTVPPDAAR